MENHPTQAQVEKAKVDLAAAQAVLAAAGLVPEAERVDRRPVEVSAVAVSLPALWPDNPAKWFLHCEGKFRLHRITSQQTMFDHCVHAMSAEQSDVVMDLMEKGPFPNCYNELKGISNGALRVQPNECSGCGHWDRNQTNARLTCCG